MIRLAICDDHPVVRTGLKAVFETDPELTVVGFADSTPSAVELAGQCDVMTMDLHLKDGDSGVQATRAILALDSPPHILVLTNYDDDADIVGAVEAGAIGYLLKDAEPQELIGAVKAAAAGKTVLEPWLLGRLAEHRRQPKGSLTPREMDILKALATGASNAEIAADQFISVTTVKSHIASVFGKLGATSRTHAVAIARERGLLS